MSLEGLGQWVCASVGLRGETVQRILSQRGAKVEESADVLKSKESFPRVWAGLTWIHLLGLQVRSSWRYEKSVMMMMMPF